MTITRKDLAHTFKLLATELHERTGETYSMETWSPGDGQTRYRVMRTVGSGEDTLYHSAYWLGAAEANAAMLAMLSVLRELDRVTK